MKLLITVFALSLPLLSSAQRMDTAPFMMQPDSVQHTLYLLAQEAPNLVGFIPETGRRYIIVPRSSTLPEYWLQRVQDAFFYDIESLCKRYGQLYLADWRALASKAARESFWGCSFLANRTFNYFGIRHRAKEWICERLGYCGYIMRNDPEPAAFAVFPSFERSLWIFLHTIYSPHFLARLPDAGKQVFDAIAYERYHGIPYWVPPVDGPPFANQLQGYPYTADEMIYTWSEHPINNLCINCDRETDRKWVNKITLAENRARSQAYRP